MKKFAIKVLCGLGILFSMNAHSAFDYWHIKENNPDEYTYNIATSGPNFFEITIKCYPNNTEKSTIITYNDDIRKFDGHQPLTGVEYSFVLDNVSGIQVDGEYLKINMNDTTSLKPHINGLHNTTFLSNIGTAEVFVVAKNNKMLALFTPSNVKPPNIAKNCITAK
ncbi:hypothetical protein [uncultured Moraxella sp.]|uniref:hypothetical protein n=1 Tax=uncultured Moraxella sp. TaxID=263769 RepID=UPI0025F09324|nr:hypothetical protein [uncultured Moraxella sp.]